MAMKDQTCQQQYPFEFSVIMAVYNVAPFLHEAVQSLISQDYGFEKIQLILVDDGSSDGSSEICDKYAAKYPKNISVIHKINGGVSSARNEGLKYATGRYLNFLDADDKLSSNTMSCISTFFTKYGEKTNVVSIPLIFFDGKKGEHPLNDKFRKGERVIDLNLEPDAIQLSMSSVFIKQEALGTSRFDSNLCFAEDAKLLIKVLLDFPFLGVTKKATYFYRRRSTGELSAVQKSENIPEWYLPYMEHFQEATIKYAQKFLGYIPPFVQYVLAHDLQTRIKLSHIPDGLLTAEEITNYKEKLTWAICHLEDVIILNQRKLSGEQKLYTLMRKYLGHYQIAKKSNNIYIQFGTTEVDYISNSRLSLSEIRLGNKECFIQGYLEVYPLDNLVPEVYVQINSSFLKCEMQNTHSIKFAIDDPVSQRFDFSCCIPLERWNAYILNFCIKIDQTVVKKNEVEYSESFPVGIAYMYSYYISHHWKVTIMKGQLKIAICNTWNHIQSEIGFLKEIYKTNKIGAKKALVVRILCHLIKLIKKTSVGIVSCDIKKVEDISNAQLVNTVRNKKMRLYFVGDILQSNFGICVPLMSWRHKILYLIADYIILLEGASEIAPPFPGMMEFYRDLLQGEKIIINK